MKKLRVIVVVGALLAWLAPTAAAQPPSAKPGPEHEHLKQMEGTWDALVRMGEGESKGTMIYKMDLGGFWLLSDFRADFGGQSFRGKGVDGYDPVKKKYVSSWVDSMSPTLLVFEGTMDKEGKTVTQLGEGPGMDGTITKLKSVTTMKDHDTIVFTMSSPDKQGKEQTMMTITYKRKK